VERVQDAAQALCDNVERVLVGKRAAVELAVVALLCEGHLLLEDVPGTGKTTLARALAQSVGGVFRRLQCTPDLLPSDVTGVSVFDQRSGEFVFRPGPVFANVLMADEINRATPRTQSAVLEAMQERQVSVDGVAHPLPRPFTVLATQNPIELEGTFPLPEAQLDRFLLRLTLGYPTEHDERLLLRRQRPPPPPNPGGSSEGGTEKRGARSEERVRDRGTGGRPHPDPLPAGEREDAACQPPSRVGSPASYFPPELGGLGGAAPRGAIEVPTLPAVLTPEEALALHAACRQVHVAEAVEQYVVALARATRQDPDVRLGASPRATLDLYHAAQARAAMQGRAFATPDDVKYVAIPVLAHRLVLAVDARLRGRDAATVVADLLNRLPVPVEYCSRRRGARPTSRPACSAPTGWRFCWP
jgi:MoxR-like ATPase